MKAYPVYKKSEIRWIGNIPNHWEVIRVKHSDIVIMGQSPNSNDYNLEEIGLPFLQGNADFTKLHPRPRVWCDTVNKIAEKDAVLVSVRAPIGSVNIADQEYGIGRGLCAIRSNSTPSTLLFYFFIALNEELNSIGTGSTYTAISVDDVKNTHILKIPLPEQQAIVDFLDRKTAQIDTLIAKKQRQIELLQEHRTALINQAVTKGLNPDAPMKDSGIEWLGKIPDHWRIVRIKHISINMISGPFGSSLTKDMYTKDGFRVYGQEQVIPADFTIGDYYISEQKYLDMQRYAISPGEVLISCVGTFGKIAVVPNDVEPGIINPRLIKVSPNRNSVVPDYLGEALSSNLTFEQLKRVSRGGTMGVINLGLLSEILLPLPPLDEQEEILYFLKNKKAKSKITRKNIENQLSLLNEYRTALISAAVTGKIDVRGEAK